MKELVCAHGHRLDLAQEQVVVQVNRREPINHEYVKRRPYAIACGHMLADLDMMGVVLCDRYESQHYMQVPYRLYHAQLFTCRRCSGDADLEVYVLEDEPFAVEGSDAFNAVIGDSFYCANVTVQA